jgi:hypothetical protein
MRLVKKKPGRGKNGDWGLEIEQSLISNLYSIKLYLFRGKFLHNGAAADGNSILVQRIKDLFAITSRVHQFSFPQNSQVMRNRRLGDACLGHNIAHAEPPAAEQAHDMLAGLIRHRFSKSNRIHSNHIDNRLFDSDYTD